MVIVAWVACAPEDLDVVIDLRPGIHDLVASVDGDPADLAWAWTRDGEPTPFSTDRLPATEVWPGHRWTVTASTADGSGSATVDVPEPPGGNVMIVIIDDVGVEKLGVYGGPDAPPTPTIDALASRGVVFRNAYASPTCTPSRAEILTGRHPSRTGAGNLIDMVESEYELPLEAWTLPEVLADAHGEVWDNSAVGKWHLSSYHSPNSHLHPTLQGFAWYAGSLGYLVEGRGNDGLDGYFVWARSYLGESVLNDVYNTTATVDDALDRIAAMPEPFLLYLAFNAPHTPLHVPPAELHTRDVTPESDGAVLHAAMLEALDTELGRLFDGIDPAVLADTTVLLVADNGTSDLAADGPVVAGQAKGTLYEGGIHVPLIVAGPHVPVPGVSDALVQLVDVFTTVAEIAGVPLTGDGDHLAVAFRGETRRLDGVSLLPWLADPSAAGPETIFAESLTPNGPPPWNTHPRMVRDQRYKLLRTSDGDQLFALDPARFDDGPDLLGGTVSEEVGAAYLRLAAVLDARVADQVYDGF